MIQEYKDKLKEVERLLEFNHSDFRLGVLNTEKRLYIEFIDKLNELKETK